MNEKIETEVFTSIEQIPRESWDCVAGDAISINHTMLLCREKYYKGSGEPRYFWVRSSNSTVAVSVALICKQTDEAWLNERIFGRLATVVGPIARSLERTLVCGKIPGPGAAIVTRRDADQQRWIRIICEAMEDYARSMSLHMSFTDVLPWESYLLSELQRRGYLQGIDRPIATLNITWSDRDSYLEALKRRKKKYAATAKTEIRRFHASGIVISRWAGTESAELYQLLRRHGEARNASGFPFRSDMLDYLFTHMGDDCIVYIARKRVALIGVCVIIRRGEKARTWLTGIDHAADANNFTYFNLVYYHPFSEFPALGIRQAYYGNAVQYAKFRRGCDIVKAQFFLKPLPGVRALLLRPLFAIHRVLLRRKYAPLIDRC